MIELLAAADTPTTISGGSGVVSVSIAIILSCSGSRGGRGR